MNRLLCALCPTNAKPAGLASQARFLSLLLLLLLATGCGVAITHLGPSPQPRNTSGSYRIEARTEASGVRDLAMTAVIGGIDQPMRQVADGLWVTDYVADPCLGGFDVRYRASYRTDPFDDAGTKTNPEVGYHRVWISGPLPSECPVTYGRRFRVTSTVDAADNDLDDQRCAADVGRRRPACTLRAAIMQANTTAGHDLIEINDGTYVLSLAGPEAPEEARAEVGDLDLTESVTIKPRPGPRSSLDPDPYIVIDGGEQFRILDVHPMPPETFVEIEELTLQNARSTGPGGAIRNRAAVVARQLQILNNITYEESSGGTSSRARGAGIYNEGRLVLRESTVRGNLTYVGASGIGSGIGGGLYNHSGAYMLVEQSLIAENAARFTGGIVNLEGEMDIVNSTVTGNRGAVGGIGISSQGGTLRLRYVTITGNRNPTRSGPALRNSRGTVDLVGVLMTGNDPLGTDCEGAFRSYGYNLISSPGAGCRVRRQSTDRIGTGVTLRPLADNGGFTETHALSRFSSSTAEVLDQGPTTALSGAVSFLQCPRTDQRGRPRPVLHSGGSAEARCDIGAFELQPTDPDE